MWNFSRLFFFSGRGQQTTEASYQGKQELGTILFLAIIFYTNTYHTLSSTLMLTVGEHVIESFKNTHVSTKYRYLRTPIL